MCSCLCLRRLTHAACAQEEDEVFRDARIAFTSGSANEASESFVRFCAAAELHVTILREEQKQSLFTGGGLRLKNLDLTALKKCREFVSVFASECSLQDRGSFPAKTRSATSPCVFALMRKLRIQDVLRSHLHALKQW